jgi:hypothetical protein
MEGNKPVLSKGERLTIFFQLLQEAEAVASHDDALALLSKVLNSVEDDFSGVGYNPEEPGTDGRMYPPNERFRYPKWERAGISCYRQVAHATFVADSGAVEIRLRAGSELGRILFEKPGKDGRRVSAYDTCG